MFTSSPRYLTLSQQVARHLDDEIRRKVWRRTLPAERFLADSLQVSRRTVRAAIAILEKDGIIRTAPGRETEILGTPAPAGPLRAMRPIRLVVPKPLIELQPFATVFIDALRTLLYANGFRLDTHHGESFFSRRPDRALKRLVSKFPCDGWILAFSNRPSQEWFCSRRLPVVVVGTAHEGVTLPFVDVDMTATARHAASVLLAKGHRSLALIIERSERAGDRKTEAGFFSAAREFGGGTAGTQLFKHNGTVMGLERLVSRLLQMRAPPTALFITNPYYYVAIASILANRGVVVPRDMSLLCRDDDFCLRYLPIAPSRYCYDPDARAKQIFSCLMRAIQGVSPQVEIQTISMMPDFFEGGSIGSPRSRES